MADRYEIDNLDLVRAWRNRFITERTSSWQACAKPYEEAISLAEADAAEFEAEFLAAMSRHGPRARPTPVVTDEMVERSVLAFLGSTGQAHKVTQLQIDLTTTCIRAALTAALTPRDDAGEAK